MITKIEMQAMDAVIGIHREMRKANEIDWEKRRYEIAKEILPHLVNENKTLAIQHGIYCSKKEIASIAVEYADLLIQELKGGNHETEESVQTR